MYIFAGGIRTKEEILKEITGTYGNIGQTAADAQTGRENTENPDVGNGISPDDAGRAGTRQRRNTRQQATDTQSRRENAESPDVDNGISSDDAGNRGTADTGGRGYIGKRCIKSWIANNLQKSGAQI